MDMTFLQLDFNVNVKTVFSTNDICNLVNEGKHVFALAPRGNLTSILPEMVTETVILLTSCHFFLNTAIT